MNTNPFPIREAPFTIRKFLEWRKLEAMTVPWGVIYLVPSAYKDWIEPTHLTLVRGTKLIAHERVHEQQIRRDGPWKFTYKYLRYLLIYGYKNNPYEIEARGGQ